MDVAEPSEFIRSGAMDVAKPYEFVRFVAMDIAKPYEFVRFVAMDFAVEAANIFPRLDVAGFLKLLNLYVF